MKTKQLTKQLSSVCANESWIISLHKGAWQSFFFSRLPDTENVFGSRLFGNAFDTRAPTNSELNYCIDWSEKGKAWYKLAHIHRHCCSKFNGNNALNVSNKRHCSRICMQILVTSVKKEDAVWPCRVGEHAILAHSRLELETETFMCDSYASSKSLNLLKFSFINMAWKVQILGSFGL